MNSWTSRCALAAAAIAITIPPFGPASPQSLPGGRASGQARPVVESPQAPGAGELARDGADAASPRGEAVAPQRSWEIGRTLWESTGSPHAGVATIGKLAGGAMLSSDRIVLADGMALSLFFVDVESGATKVVGRRGDGPGDFRAVRSIGRTASGGVFADDPLGARVTAFDEDGSLVETVDYNPADFRGFVWIPRPIGVHADGAVVFRDSDPMFTERPDGPYRARIDYLALRPDGERVPIAEAEGLEQVRLNCSPPGGPIVSFNAFEKPFSHSTVEAADGDLLIVGDTESGAISAYDRSGAVVAEFHFGRGARVTAESDRMWRERKIEQLAGRTQRPVAPLPDDVQARMGGLLGQPMCGEDGAGIEFYRTAEANAVAPAFSRMIVDGEGRLWVRRYALPGEEEATWSRWRWGESRDRMETIALPGEYELLDAFGDTALLGATDEFGVERAVVAMLRASR